MTLHKEIEPTVSEGIQLVPLTQEHTDLMTDWFTKPEIYQWMYPGSEHATPEDIRNWVERITSDPNKHFFIINTTEKPIGVASIKQIKDSPTIGEVGIAIGDLNEQEKGYGTNALEKILAYGKNTLHLSNIIAIIHPDNTRSIKLFSHFQFQKTDVSIEGMQLYLLPNN